MPSWCCGRVTGILLHWLFTGLSSAGQMITSNTHLKETRFTSVSMFPACIFSIPPPLKHFFKLVQQLVEFWPASPVMRVLWWNSEYEENEWRDRPRDPKERERGSKNKTVKGCVLESEGFHEGELRSINGKEWRERLKGILKSCSSL